MQAIKLFFNYSEMQNLKKKKAISHRADQALFLWRSAQTHMTDRHGLGDVLLRT